MIAFFCGHKMSSKRYKSYFTKINLIYDPQNNDIHEYVIIHSIGLVNALMHYNEFKFKPTLIVAMDPPNISRKSIQEKINNIPDDLKQIYSKFLELKIQIENYNIVVFRNIKNKDYSDSSLYKQIYYYDEDTHYPYMNAKIRDHIVKLVT